MSVTLISGILIVWVLMGIIGYALYLSNPNTRPKKFFLCCIAFSIHCCMGFIALLYGYICFSNRKNKLSEEI
jgi:hypothetical protein